MLQGSWVAGRGGKDAVFEGLGLVETPQFAGMDLPTAAGAEFPEGWTVVEYRKPWRFGEKGQPPASANGEVIWGTCSDIVMWSGLYCRNAGERLWSIEHNPEYGVEHIEVTGTPPDIFASLRDDFLTQQRQGHEDVDYVFDLPLALMGAITGYDPNHPGPGGGAFRVLEPRLTGKAGERQRAELEFDWRLMQFVEEDLMTAARTLGFQPTTELVGDFPSARSPLEMVRFRDGLSEIIELEGGWLGGRPRIAIRMFVREGLKPRGGRSGVVETSGPSMGFFDALLGKREEPEVALARVSAEGRELIDVLDRYLKEGVRDKRLTPPTYVEM